MNRRFRADVAALAVVLALVAFTAVSLRNGVKPKKKECRYGVLTTIVMTDNQKIHVCMNSKAAQ